MKLLTAEQMVNVDRITIENGTPGIELMRNAGEEVYLFMERTLDSAQPVVVIAGKGNNGGDGFRVAELLLKNGWKVEIFLLGEKGTVRGDAARCLADLEKVGGTVVEVPGPEMTLELTEGIASAGIIVDAIFGTGLKGEVTGFPAEIIGAANASGAVVIAVDIPSGVNATTGEASSASVQADYTVTFGCPKAGHVFQPGRVKSGEVHVVDIGFSGEVIATVESLGNALTPSEAAVFLPKRSHDAYKGSVGKVLVLAGSVGMTGAATLASRAALRVGAGVVTVGCPASLNDILEVKLTEVMTVPLPEVGKKRCLSLRALGRVRAMAYEADVVALGPGLGVYHETVELVRRFLAAYEGRVILDADGINAFKDAPEALAGASCEMVLTPHCGELSRITGKAIPEILGDPVAAAREAAHALGQIVLLKGSPTIIADPAGTVWINSTGNEGMATAGMGDVLTGILAGFAAQGCTLFDAAVLGAYVHGLAGDHAAEERGILGMISGDVLGLLPNVLNELATFT